MLTCGTWVRKGIAKEIPDKITLAEEDLKQLVEDTKDKIRNIKGNENINLEDELSDVTNDNEGEKTISEHEDDIDNVASDHEGKDTAEYDSDDAIREEYGLDNYDDEGAEMTGAGMTGLMYFTSNDDDPYINIKDLEEEERSDALIKGNDNLFVVGKMEEEYSSLDVYVYNEEENNLYVHHDILLESFPLCLEWLSFDPGAEGKSGNYVAVGTMEPDIQIWDLDIIDTLEPAFVLGGRKKKKKKKKKKSSTDETETNKNGHTDAVLSLAWNKSITKIMASSSADMTVLLWDMSQCTCVHTLEHHTDKVQSISWHPVEAQSLLTGSFDKTAVVLDCRTPDVYKTWSLPGECEQVIWDHFSPYNFFVTTDDGIVSYFDVRTDTPVFKVHAHDKEVTGISLSKDIPGYFTTVSADESLKVWSYKENKALCILSRDMKMGGLNFVTSCPDIGLTCALGGQNDGLRILNLLETAQGKAHFQSAPSHKTVDNSSMKTKKTKNTSGESQMETDHATEALATLSLKKDNETENVIIKRKKKKKKK